MDYLYIAIGGFVILTAFMNPQLLVREGSFRIILLGSAVLFTVGLVDLVLCLMGVVRFFISGALLCPLITLMQYRLSRRVFLKYVNREPKDTFFVYSGNDLGKDRLFNLLYFIPALWILLLVTGGIERLVRNSW